ncbi:hypothetical protein EMIHUDRAFT_237254 [Emiliania huxleyi CCMP1516]|uniref:Fatty acid desaturase domain-containing protein n=2 Tax=Emiliania huxleyi TaxID=2903 RepID=A0A0D3JR47_EMIH1|nr:hypothetical protein EMIHUDRAFT_237254 [Emiliania huxleyi CCMP1516]EOD25982.1 hypothetical protein EMIHUDRAFT_237254 [Emiliania huxleyi CCMP1516]|eukprot:XP_005778411.1 hypothetical protein EMIHUDRAFT_237254 [Emiliania huxleyi CCMP1516]
MLALSAAAPALPATTAAGRGVLSPAQPTPSEWHRARRRAILEAHPSIVRSLVGKETTTVPLLAAANLAQVGACIAGSHLPGYELAPAAVLVGGTLSLWQFALLHDVKHGTAELPRGVRINDVVFWGSLPSLFGYYLYLRWGHLSHHANFGERRIAELFDSEQDKFEDGDVMFVAHRQLLLGDERSERPGFFGGEQVGGLGLSISRTIYAWLWSGREGWAWYNAMVYAVGMAYERAALVVGGGWVPALAGRNFFFPNKPQAFHSDCAAYARASAALQLLLVGLAGPGALWWLFWAEVGWQLPIHPASAMFVSNHPSLDAPRGEGVGGCQPTASIYLEGAAGEAFDWLCCFSNYHTEHHDFPDVPAFRLKQLRDAAPEFYADAALAGARDGWRETMRRTFEGRGFYACTGALETVDEAVEQWSYGPTL